MLVLTRSKDESIMIGDTIVVTVIDVTGDRVRLGIQAPREVAVHRREVYDAIHDENRAAAQAPAADLTALGDLFKKRDNEKP